MPNTISPNMGLIVPGVGTEPGPAWANDLNSDLGILDQHDHSSGQGVRVTPNGLNINSDLPIGGNNLTAVKTVNFTSLGAPLAGLAPNLGAVYVSGNELYYNDEIGNVVQITNVGSVNSGAGSITGLPSGTASASYSAGGQKFIWQSATSTAAGMDNGPVTIREIVANANGVTLNSPSSLAASYSLTFPAALPGATSFATIDTSGNIGATIPVSQGINTSNIANNAITTPKIADGAVTYSKTSAPNLVSNDAADGSIHSNSTTTFVQIAPDVTITTIGNPVMVGLRASFVGANESFILADNGDFVIRMQRDGTDIVLMDGGITNTYTPVSGYFLIDTGASAGTHTYSFQGAVGVVAGDIAWLNVGSYALEIR